MRPEIARIYDRLPTIHCKQKCHESCGPIPLFPAETLILLPKTDKSFVRSNMIMFDDARRCCPHLTPNKKCDVYQERPLMCRLFGLVKRMRCPFGCRPSRWLSNEEADVLMESMGKIISDPTCR